MDTDLGALRLAKTEVDPAGLATDVPAAHGDLAPLGLTAGLDLDPRPHGVWVGPGLREPERQPVPHGYGPLGIARADVAPDLGRLTEVHPDDVQHPVQVQVDDGRAAGAGEVDQAGLLRALDESAGGCAQHEAAGVGQRTVGHGLHVALRHEEVHEPVVVDVLELRVPGGRGALVIAGDREARSDPKLLGDIPVGRTIRVPSASVSSRLPNMLVR